MPGKWATEAAVAKAKEWLAEEYPGEKVEILDTFDIAWPGWAGDNQGAIVRRGHEVDVVIVDGSSIAAERPLFKQLVELTTEYGRMAVDLADVLKRSARLKLDAANAAIAFYSGTALDTEELGPDAPPPPAQVPEELAPEDPSSSRARRRRLTLAVGADAEKRRQFDAIVAMARQLTGSGDAADAVSDLLWLVLNVEPRPEAAEPARALSDKAVAKWHSISFPLMPGDEGMRPDELNLKYSMLEVLSWLRGGITPPELADRGLDDAFPVLSKWVDDARGAKSNT